MSGLAQVPGWFWVALAAILAVGAAVAGVLRARLRSGVWRWRYRPAKHRARPETMAERWGWAEPEYLPAAVATVPVAAVTGEPPWELAQPMMRLPDRARREQMLASLSLETDDPELFTCIYCEQDTPNGEPCPVCGWDRCAVCLRCVDQAAHDLGQAAASGQEGPEAAQVNSLPAPTRLASATDVALARCDAFMARMVADHKQWLADARERWAAA